MMFNPTRRSAIAAILSLPLVQPSSLMAGVDAEQEQIFARWRAERPDRAEGMIAAVLGGCSKCGCEMKVGKGSVVTYRNVELNVIAVCDACGMFSIQA